MRKLLCGIVLATLAGAVSANNCPNEMKAIDAAMSGSKLGAAQMSEVKKLRAEGERLHREGKHADSMAALGKAKGMLGIK
ncbi:MAG: hypothetical protein IT531_08945 [Burkholderiales bacterium]|nr:hypothetical protein [Burkholderiales bacterium]